MILLLGLGMVLAGCHNTSHMARELPQPDPLALTTVQPEYRLAPGDVLLVKVFQVDDLERQVRIDNDGKLSLPLIGAIPAAGVGVAELERQVADRYRNGFLQDPQVSIFVQEANGDPSKLIVGGYVMVGAILTNKAPVTLDAVTPIARLTGERASAALDWVTEQGGLVQRVPCGPRVMVAA